MTEPRLSHEEAMDLAALYVLGALTPGEEAAVRDHLGTCSLSHAEIDELGGVVPALIEAELAETDLVEPPASLRDRIMAAAAADLDTGRTAPAQATAPRAAPVAFPSAAERTARAGRRRTSPFDWALRIAAVLAIVVSGAYALNVQAQLDQARQFDQAVAAVVQAGSQPNAKTVVLATQTGQRGAGIGAVQADGSVVLALRDLAATSGEQSYTAWVIVGNNPVNVGDFRVDASGIRSFTTKAGDTPVGAVIAVTLEAQAGNTAPAGPIVVAGQAAAPPPSSG
ncbi:MAG TPA: anti-sigma factor [Candidatus Limnocylindrales bacterium]|nr:anti-sigma factor [Candidatus Limnocylindrales bacterium]